MSTPSQILSMFLGVPCGEVSLRYEQPSHLTRTGFRHGQVNVSLSFTAILGEQLLPEWVGCSVEITHYTVSTVELMDGPVKIAQCSANIYPGDETTELLRSLSL